YRSGPSPVKRTQRIRCEEAKVVVMQYRFRFDRSVVADGHGPIRLTGLEGRRGFGNGHRAANTLVCNACVCAAESVSNANMAYHVIGQLPQQPHRVNCDFQLAAESRHVPPGLLEQGKEFVRAAEGCAA